MAKFKPGEPKKGGRQAGTPNRTSAEIRQVLLLILNNNLDRLQTAINDMDDKEATRIIIQLVRHLTYPEVLPDRLSEEQLEQVVEFYRRKYGKTENQTGNT